MLFSSLTFIFVFLPVVFLLYWAVRKDLRNTVLLLSSLFFYGWGEPTYLCIMLSVILINYFGGLLIDKYKNKVLLVLIIAANLAILGYFKYFDFLIENINLLFRSNIDFIHVVLPIGISFYTFQALSYVIDLYRGGIPVQKDLHKLALYISLFPQLVAGPIVKYKDVAEQIEEREVDWNLISLGIKRFIIGLSKKVLIANTMGAIADKIFNESVCEISTITSWIGALAYSFQIFFDFSGYSDMAIGLGLIFGFKFKENFNFPYISKSITEFWRRWHISLSSWFKEYVYIPLGGNRKGEKRTLINIFIVFLLTGLWHGASWNFIFWGIWHGIFNIIEKATNLYKETESKYKEFFKHVYTLFVVVLGWVMFRAETGNHALEYIKNMFGLLDNQSAKFEIEYYIGNLEIITFAVAFILSIPIMNKININIKETPKKIITNALLLTLLLINVAFLASSTYNPFIYFRF